MPSPIIPSSSRIAAICTAPWLTPMQRGSPAAVAGERAPGQVQGSLGIAENHDGGSVRGVEHDAAPGRKLRGGHRTTASSCARRRACSWTGLRANS